MLAFEVANVRLIEQILHGLADSFHISDVHVLVNELTSSQRDVTDEENSCLTLFFCWGGCHWVAELLADNFKLPIQFEALHLKL